MARLPPVYFCGALRKLIHVISISLFCLIVNICSGQAFGNTLSFSKSEASAFRRHYEDTVWTVSGWTPLDSKYRKRRLDFVLDGRQTFINGANAKIGGFRIGIEYRRVHRFGLGFYNLDNGVVTNSLAEIDPRISSATLFLKYNSIYYERVLYFHRRWEWSLTAHLGKGTITGHYLIPHVSEAINFERKVKPVEISSTMYYNLNWWISVGAGVGYRYMRNTPDEVQSIYNSPVLIVKLRFKFGKLIKGAFNKDVRSTY